MRRYTKQHKGIVESTVLNLSDVEEDFMLTPDKEEFQRSGPYNNLASKVVTYGAEDKYKRKNDTAELGTATFRNTHASIADTKKDLLSPRSQTLGTHLLAKTLPQEPKPLPEKRGYGKQMIKEHENVG